MCKYAASLSVELHCSKQNETDWFSIDTRTNRLSVPDMVEIER